MTGRTTTKVTSAPRAMGVNMKYDEKENAPFHHKRSTPVPGDKNHLKSDKYVVQTPAEASTSVHFDLPGDKTHLKFDESVCGADSPQELPPVHIPIVNTHKFAKLMRAIFACEVCIHAKKHFKTAA